MPMRKNYSLCKSATWVLMYGLVAASAVRASALDGDESRNAIYLHPVSILSTAAVPLFSDNNFTGLQVDYERSIKPHFAGIGSISYLSFDLTYQEYKVDAHIFDVMAGIRWYPFEDFTGMYVQGMLDYNWSAGDADSAKPAMHGRVDQSRLGPMLYWGVNRRIGHLAIDWNLGVGYLPWDNTYKKTGTRQAADSTLSLTKKIGQPWTGFLMGSPQFGTNFSLGWTF